MRCGCWLHFECLGHGLKARLWHGAAERRGALLEASGALVEPGGAHKGAHRRRRTHEHLPRSMWPAPRCRLAATSSLASIAGMQLPTVVETDLRPKATGTHHATRRDSQSRRRRALCQEACLKRLPRYLGNLPLASRQGSVRFAACRYLDLRVEVQWQKEAMDSGKLWRNVPAAASWFSATSLRNRSRPCGTCLSLSGHLQEMNSIKCLRKGPIEFVLAFGHSSTSSLILNARLHRGSLLCVLCLPEITAQDLIVCRLCPHVRDLYSIAMWLLSSCLFRRHIICPTLIEEVVWRLIGPGHAKSSASGTPCRRQPAMAEGIIPTSHSSCLNLTIVKRPRPKALLRPPET